MPSKRDFWGLFQKFIIRADNDWRKVRTEAQLRAFERRWLDNPGGIVARLQGNPIVAKADATARKLFCMT